MFRKIYIVLLRSLIDDYGKLPYVSDMATLTRKLPPTAAPAGRVGSTARLEARIPTSLKEIIEAAAGLTGYSSVTAYIVQTLQESATRTLQESRHTRLEAAESVAFVQSLLEPAAPTKALQAAFKRYRDQAR
jgi:uncharacterized protein (DUF1778 family)